VFAHHALLFSAVIDPLVARPVFSSGKLLPEGEFLLGIHFSRLFSGHSTHVLRSTVRECCRSATKPARNPKKVKAFARYGP
jgi:hypothetical protein